VGVAVAVEVAVAVMVVVAVAVAVAVAVEAEVAVAVALAVGVAVAVEVGSCVPLGMICRGRGWRRAAGGRARWRERGCRWSGRGWGLGRCARWHPGGSGRARRTRRRRSVVLILVLVVPAVSVLVAFALDDPDCAQAAIGRLLHLENQETVLIERG